VCVYIYICVCVCVCPFNNENVIFLKLDLQRVGQIGVPSVKDRICNSTIYGHGFSRSLTRKGGIINFAVAL